MTIAEVINAGPGQPVTLTAWVKVAWPIGSAGKGTKLNAVLHDGASEVKLTWWDPTCQLEAGQQVHLQGQWGAPKGGVNIPQGAYSEVYDGTLRIVAKKTALSLVGGAQPAGPAQSTYQPQAAPPAPVAAPPPRRPDPAWGAGAGLPAQPAPAAPAPQAAPPVPGRPPKMTAAEARAFLIVQFRAFQQTSSDIPAEALAAWSTSILISYQRGDIAPNAPPQAQAAQAAGGFDDDDIPF